MSESFSRASDSQRVTLVRASITSVDVANHSAEGSTRHAKVYIDTSYYVGSVQVTPTLGDQWYVAAVEGGHRLHSRIPFNDPNQITTTPTQGQHVIGSGQGPIRLQAGSGNVISADTPVAVAAYSTTNRPNAGSVPAGSHIYDTTLGKPLWSNGSAWHDAVGTAV